MLVWAVAFVILVVFGKFIGLIIALVLLFFIIGGLNTFLTELIWDIYVRSSWQSILGHGLALFIILLIVAIPNIIIDLVVPGLATTIALFIIYCFIDGFIARKVGFWFEEYPEEENFHANSL